MTKQAIAAALALLMAGLTTAPQAAAACTDTAPRPLADRVAECVDFAAATVAQAVEDAERAVEDLAPPLTDLFPSGAILIHDPGTGPATLATPPGWTCGPLTPAGASYSVSCTPPTPPLGFVNKCGTVKSDGIGFGVGAMEVEAACPTLSTTTGPFFTGPNTNKVFSPTATGNSLFPFTCTVTLAGTPAPWWAHCVVNPGPVVGWGPFGPLADGAVAAGDQAVAVAQATLANLQATLQPAKDQAAQLIHAVAGSNDLFPTGKILIHDPGTGPALLYKPPTWTCTPLTQAGSDYSVSCTPPLPPLGFTNKCGTLKSDGIGLGFGAMEVEASCAALSTTTGVFFTGPNTSKVFSPTVTGNTLFPVTCTATVVGAPAPWWAHCLVNVVPGPIGDEVALVEQLLPL